MPTSKFQNEFPTVSSWNTKTAAFTYSPKETDFFAWNLILDYPLQPGQELPAAWQQKENWAWHDTELGGHLQKGKPVSNSLADILGICLIQSGSKGQLKKYTGIEKKVPMAKRYFAIYC